MAVTADSIITDIENHIERNGGAFPNWYIGVTDRPKHALFTQHAVRQKGGGYITRTARDDEQARSVQDYFRSVRGTRGRNVAGSADHIVVYAYLIMPHTKQG